MTIYTLQNLTGAEHNPARFVRKTEVIPRRPWKSKSAFASRHITISRKLKNTRTQGVRARYDALLPPVISIVQAAGLPVILTHGGKIRFADIPPWLHAASTRRRIAARQFLPLNCSAIVLTAGVIFWMRLLGLQLEASCLQWSFLLTIYILAFYLQLELFCLQF